MHARLMLVLSVASLLGGCAERTSGPRAPAPAQEIVVDGVRLMLDAFLNRDFMPFTPPDGKPMFAMLTVRSVDGVQIPSGLTWRSATVSYAGQQWESVPGAQPSSDPAVLLGRSAGGPKWGPGVLVDVVVTLERDGKLWTLSQSDVLVNRSD
jgi:hypothetical protein